MRRVGRPPIGSAARRLIAIRLDPEVLKRFRSKAKRLEVGYQTLIHRLLAEHVGARVGWPVTLPGGTPVVQLDSASV
jgi:uncharacterized protein (DUF4415 family)